MSRLAAALIVRLAAALLPAAMRDWGRAMVAETETIGRDGAALRFSLGCLWTAFSLRLSRLFAEQELVMPLPLTLIDRPRRFAAACAAAAIGLGFFYMAAAGAPGSYFAMNGAALALGLLMLGALAEAARLGRIPSGVIALSLSGLLLLVSVAGVSADGVTRWITVGGVALQPALIFVPILALSFARSRGGLSALAVALAALALAFQPDRAMAGALMTAMVALALTRRDWTVLAALVAVVPAFVVTMLRPDASPAMPFVDQIFFSAFAVHPLAGIAVAGGALLMLIPAIVGMTRDTGGRAAYAVFGATWLAVIAAAALGNYPTPLVGYGGSAILGYLISLIGLPSRAGEAAASPVGEPNVERGDGPVALKQADALLA